MQSTVFVFTAFVAMALYFWRNRSFARNISTHKLYEQELLKRTRLQEQLSSFSASAPGFFFSYLHGLNGSNSMPFASVGIYELFGLRPEDVAQNIAPLNLLIHPDDRSQLINSIACSAADLSPLEIEFRTAHPDKGELWIESRAKPVLNQDGSIVWHGFMHDITLRKRMDESLHHSLKHLADAQRIGKMGSWELDLATGILTWSDEIYRILEIDQALFEASYGTYLNAIHPDDREAASKAYTAALYGNASSSFDYRFSFLDGRIKYIHECVETQYEADRRPHQSHGTVQDITSLKITEQQLKGRLDKLRELVISRELLREDEHKRLAWELHEELGQLLSAMKMRMSGLRSQLQKNGSPQAEDSLEVIELIDNSIRTVHDIVSELRPTVLLHGVVAALEWLVDEFNKQPGLECELKIDEEEGVFVSDEMTTLVFRIAQEALENAMRHTSVTRVLVSWKSNKNNHCLAVQHDGATHAAELSKGKSLSIFGMQERISAFGGEMQVFNTLDHGTVIEASFQHKR